jgi:hypothetical protein
MDNPRHGMELLCRVMYDMQQDYFMWFNKTAAGQRVNAPDFQEVIDLVNTFRADRLSALPPAWIHMLNDAVPAPTAPARQAPAQARSAGGGSTTSVNPNADRRLMQRYKDSGHASITAMVGGRSLEYPKHSNKPVCMAWAIKGACTTNCKRAAQHVRYSADTLKEVHKFMDDCGVAGSQ